MKITIRYVEFNCDRHEQRGTPLTAIDYAEWKEGAETFSAHRDDIPREVHEALALIIAPWLAPKAEA